MEQVAIQHYGMDAVFDSVAADEPAFAGSYLGPDGRMVLNVARGGVLRNVSHVIEGVTPLRRRSELGRPEFLMSSTDAPAVRTVDWTWKELIEAKDKVLMLPDDRALSSVDADERLNRVVVGVVAAAETASVRAALRQAGVADGIARLEVQPLAGQDRDLTSRVRPMGGGLNIGPTGCTATIVARWNGVPVLLTNAHCTAVRKALDRGPMWQPHGRRDPFFGYITYETYTPFGAEVFDLNTYTCGPWLNRRQCRRADLAAYSLTGIDVNEGETAFALGAVYRPVEQNWGVQMRYGSLTIDPQNPTFRVAGTIERASGGLVLHRVGATTGWQTGSVYKTCVDHWWFKERPNLPVVGFNNERLVCQTEAHLFSEPGDSGSPVFSLLSDGTILFAGINWGSNFEKPGSENFFSDVTQMRQEMSGLVFTP